MRLRAFILSTAFVLLMGCHGQKPQKNEQFSNNSEAAQLQKAIRPFRINIGTEPQSLDPRKARDLTSFSLMRMLFDGLTRVNKNEKPELAIAERVSISDDLKTYTFVLRSSYWSNGDPLTAEDFVYSWKKILDPSFPSDYAFQLYVIKNGQLAKEGKIDLDQIGVRAIDSKTLVLELEKPTPFILELLCYPAFFPINRNIDMANPHWAEKVETYVSNGPFILKEWKHDDKISVAKNLKYWDAAAVKLPEIQLVMVKEDSEYFMFQNGELDWAGSPLSVLPLDSLRILKSRKTLQLKPLLGTYFLRVNTGRNFLKDPKLRKALALAINRKALIDNVALGNQIPAKGLVPSVMGLQKEAYFSDGDVAKAKQEFIQFLNDEKIDLNHFPQFKLMYAHGERNQRMAEAIQQQWFEVFGFQVNLEAVERKIYFDRSSSLDYDISIGSWIGDYNDPVTFLEVFKNKSVKTNNTGWEHPKFIQILDKSYEENDKDRRLEMLSMCEQILINEMPIIPIFHYSMAYLNNKDLKDVALPPSGNIDFKWAYFDGEMQ